LKSLADSYGQPFDNVKKYYQDHDLVGGLKEQLREEKTLDFLLSEAAVTEKK
jgi:FKBP-type peptidyl-prolyl cis-trans isomerase (trigger factor)